MAKRFYYHGKNNQPQNDGDKNKTVALAQPKNNVSAKPDGKAPQGQRNRDKGQKAVRPTQPQQTSYPKDKVSIALESVGVSPATCELLAKNHINTIGDLVVRSEKDMFKVQGFNKKMLFELRDALKLKGMSFKPEQPKADKNVEKAPQKQPPKQKDKKNTQQKPQSKHVEKLSEPLSVENWRKIQKGGKWGFYDGFKTVIPASYDEVFCFKEGLASVELDEKCGYIDSENNVVIPFDYETAMSFSEGLAAVCKVTKFGYIDKENNVVIPFEYDAATSFENGEAKVKKDGKWGTITPNGEIKWII